MRPEKGLWAPGRAHPAGPDERPCQPRRTSGRFLFPRTRASEQPGPGSQLGGKGLPGCWHQPRAVCAWPTLLAAHPGFDGVGKARWGGRAGWVCLKLRWENKRRPWWARWAEATAGAGRPRREGCGARHEGQWALGSRQGRGGPGAWQAGPCTAGTEARERHLGRWQPAQSHALCPSGTRRTRCLCVSENSHVSPLGPVCTPSL